jgi:uncharacterized protein YkwD
MRTASTILFAALLACAACATCAAVAPQGALAGPGNASSSSYQSTSKHGPARSHARARHRFGKRCARHAGYRARRGAAGAKHARRPAAHVHARGTRCSEHLPRRHPHRSRLRHSASGRGRSHRGTHPIRHRIVQHHARRHHAAHSPSAGRSSTCANASIRPAAENLALVRDAVLCLINGERRGAGERPLTAVASLYAAAQRHTEDMAFEDYFEHIGPRGDTPSQRMRATGYLSGAQFYEVGENIALGTGWMASPRAIVAGWMASPGHRANILDANFRDTGIGATAPAPASLSGGPAGAIYTEDFAVTSG